MAKFIYRMQSILNVKEKLETQAKQEFAAAKAALDTEQEKLVKLFARKAAYEEAAEVLRSGSLKVREIMTNQAAIERIEEYIEDQKARIRKAEELLEAARNKLREVMQERKMHEKLKEHAFEAFVSEEKRQEGKEVDELTSYTYGQRIMEKAALPAGKDA